MGSGMGLKWGSIGGMKKGVRVLLGLEGDWDGRWRGCDWVVVLVWGMRMKGRGICDIGGYMEDIRCWGGWGERGLRGIWRRL